MRLRSRVSAAATLLVLTSLLLAQAQLVPCVTMPAAQGDGGTMHAAHHVAPAGHADHAGHSGEADHAGAADAVAVSESAPAADHTAPCTGVMRCGWAAVPGTRAVAAAAVPAMGDMALAVGLSARAAHANPATPPPKHIT